MGYEKIVNSMTEYTGESFSQALKKKGGAAWTTNEVAEYMLVNIAGDVISSGPLVKSADNKELLMTIPKSDTVNLNGKHKVIVDLLSADDSNISDVIAEYDIMYKARTA